MDVTTYTMILVCKLWMLSFSYKDGGEDHKNLLPREIEHKVDTLPNFFEYMSYVCYASGAVVGPVFEYKDFKNFIELSGQYQDMPRGLNSYVAFVPAMKKFIGSLLCLAVHVGIAISGYSVYFCGSKEFITHGNFFTRVVYYFIAMSSQRLMYYSPWLLNDSGSIASGLGYTKTIKDKDGKVLEYEYDRVISVYMINLETSVTCVKMMSYWNHTVHLWLNHYV